VDEGGDSGEEQSTARTVCRNAWTVKNLPLLFSFALLFVDATVGSCMHECMVASTGSNQILWSISQSERHNPRKEGGKSKTRFTGAGSQLLF
jgi:hypothetical protein